MEEFPWGQMFTTIAALGGAAIGAWGTSWGALRRDERQRTAEATRAEAEARYAALRKFTAVLLSADRASGLADWREIRFARTEFIATLRAGETAVADAADAALRAVSDAPVSLRQQVAVEQTDYLFAWLRGDQKIE